jgi:hypothetical protein
LHPRFNRRLLLTQRALECAFWADDIVRSTLALATATESPVNSTITVTGALLKFLGMRTW